MIRIGGDAIDVYEDEIFLISDDGISARHHARKTDHFHGSQILLRFSEGRAYKKLSRAPAAAGAANCTINRMAIFIMIMQKNRRRSLFMDCGGERIFL